MADMNFDVNDKNIPIVEIDGTTYGLAGWNAEKHIYTDCFVYGGLTHEKIGDKRYTVKVKYSADGGAITEYSII
jgi:hypothetical protein